MHGTTKSDSLALGTEQFEEISNLFLAHAGIKLGKTKILTAQSRLKPRVHQLGLSDFDEYIDLLKGNTGADERVHFYNALTTNTTSFFREGHHFEHLQEEIERGLGQGQQEFNIWSAGCSSGQEPYTIAMVLRSITTLDSAAGVKLLATDLNSQELSVARAGTYAKEQMENIPPKYHKYFRVSGDRFEFTDQIKNMISFRQLNMFEAWPIRVNFDFIFCRNVMIYFATERRDELFSRFVSKLNPNGCLYLGHSESSLTATDDVAPTGITTFRRHG